MTALHHDLWEWKEDLLFFSSSFSPSFLFCCYPSSHRNGSLSKRCSFSHISLFLLILILMFVLTKRREKEINERRAVIQMMMMMEVDKHWVEDARWIFVLMTMMLTMIRKEQNSNKNGEWQNILEVSIPLSTHQTLIMSSIRWRWSSSSSSPHVFLFSLRLIFPPALISDFSFPGFRSHLSYTTCNIQMSASLMLERSANITLHTHRRIFVPHIHQTSWWWTSCTSSYRNVRK